MQTELPTGLSRDVQYYHVRICPTWHWTYTTGGLKKATDDAFEEMQAASIAAAESRISRLARTTRDKVEDVADDLKVKTLARTKGIAARLKAKSTHLGRDLKEKAEEGVKDGASKAVKGAFWKTLGY